MRNMYVIFHNFMRYLLKDEGLRIDNNVFRLHYRTTLAIMIMASILIAGMQNYVNPIVCLVDRVPRHIMESYCWIHGTFTVINLNSNISLTSSVGPYVEGKDVIRHHRYYCWVSVVILMQAGLLYIPRLFWRTIEQGRLRAVTNHLHEISVEQPIYEDSKNDTVAHFIDNLNTYNFYVIRFYFCELLNLVNICFQIYLMDVFLGGAFTTYGLDVIRLTDMDPNHRIDPMDLVFPKVAKCSFKQYGPSGFIQLFDGICVLPLNIINERVYVLLWLWFLIMALFNIIHIINQTVLFFLSPSLRLELLKSKIRLSNKRDVKTVFRMCQIGDWFMLCQLARNVRPQIMKAIIEDLAKYFELNQTKSRRES